MTLQLQMLAQAFICDVTRVASFQYGVGNNDQSTFSFLSDPTYFPNGVTTGHHDLSHRVDTLDNNGNPYDPQGRMGLILINRWFADRLAYFMSLLDAVPEGNGTVLDNTLIVWGSDIGHGIDHTADPALFFVAGGAGGAITTGQFLNLPNGTLHNRLLVSIAHAMGRTDINSFGTSDTGSGPIAQLMT